MTGRAVSRASAEAFVDSKSCGKRLIAWLLARRFHSGTGAAFNGRHDLPRTIISDQSAGRSSREQPVTDFLLVEGAAGDNLKQVESRAIKRRVTRSDGCGDNVGAFLFQCRARPDAIADARWLACIYPRRAIQGDDRRGQPRLIARLDLEDFLDQPAWRLGYLDAWGTAPTIRRAITAHAGRNGDVATMTADINAWADLADAAANVGTVPAEKKCQPPRGVVLMAV